MMTNYPKSAIFLFFFKFQHYQPHLHPIVNAFELIPTFLIKSFLYSEVF